MNWDLDTLHRTLERADATTPVDTVWTPAYQARVDEPGVLWVSWVDRAEDPTSLWEELRDLASTRGCSAIRYRATDRLTPSEHEQALVGLGFAVEAEGHILGAPIASVEPWELELMVETGTGRAIAASRRVLSTLWRAPEADPDEAHDVVVWMDGYQPASAGRLTMAGGLGMLERGGTLPEYRRRGGYAATVDARLMLARTVGCQRVVAHTDNAHAERVLLSRGLEIIEATRLYTLGVQPL